MIQISNDGQAIVSTNFWETAAAQAGFLFASWNAGALRLLIPAARLGDLAEMKTGKMVIVTRGSLQGHAALEIMFDDDNQSPYAAHIGLESCDREIPRQDDGREILVSAWGQEGLLATWPGRYRIGTTLPDMSSWIAG